MNRIMLCIIISVLCVSNTYAQWSVLEGDPRIQQNRSELYLYQVFSKKEWNASNFASPADMRWHEIARYGMFIHFGLSAHENKDLSWPIVYNRKMPDAGHGEYTDSAWQNVWPSEFRLEKFNADEWVNIAKRAGMKYIIVIAKHHDGFHMWDTKYSDFKITNTPFKRDYLKELADACHKGGMRFGIYYSQRDWYHPDYAPIDSNTVDKIKDPPYYKAKPGTEIKHGITHQKYIDYQFNVVEELCTKYGKIDEFWFDAVYWGGMFTADMWESEKLTRMIRLLQPGIIINNRASLPGDFDTPEQRIGMYQRRPWESAMTLNGSWAYSPEPVKPVKDLLREMLMAAAGNGNVLLSWGAKWNGEFDAAQKDSLLKIGRWLKQYGSAYYGTHGGPWMPTEKVGAVYNAKTVYLYVFNWSDEGVKLSGIGGNPVVSATLLNVKEKLKWKVEGDKIVLSKPGRTDSIVTLVKLVMTKPVRDVNAATVKSIFSDPAFGRKILVKTIEKTEWESHFYTVDFGVIKNITGLYFPEKNAAIQIDVSIDGVTWQEMGTVDESSKEMAFTTFMTGINLPGRKLRYIRLHITGDAADVKFDVFAK